MLSVCVPRLDVSDRTATSPRSDLTLPFTSASAVACPVAHETFAATFLYSPLASLFAEMVFVLNARMLTFPETVWTVARSPTVTVASDSAFVTSTAMPNGTLLLFEEMKPPPKPTCTYMSIVLFEKAEMPTPWVDSIETVSRISTFAFDVETAYPPPIRSLRTLSLAVESDRADNCVTPSEMIWVVPLSVTVASASSMLRPKNGRKLESHSRTPSNCVAKELPIVESLLPRKFVSRLYATARAETFRPWSTAL